GFVGANDGGGGTAAVVELARDLRGRRRPGGPELRFVLFDGEESPRGSPDSAFLRDGLRGSKAYAAAHRGEIGSVVLLDFVANPHIRLRREARSDPGLWAALRRAAARAGVSRAFPPGTAPGGYCAGVDRAVQTVEHALRLYGAPVYVRKEIVHNKHVVQQLREKGAIFVEEETEVPEGSTVVFSAHGVAPGVHRNAADRELFTIDATCPLVTKVHVEARKFAAEGYTIVLVGHAGHEEVEGTMGEAPGQIVLVESEEDVDRLEVD